ncbi:unnamed protein product, partial [Mesorhabditis belari]|uniref:Protein inscuteable homologue C-terminal domain-containing protein n=1 Tax=Mesorhabditis belari TaxID=2138241 RepID=A0AAF3EFA7_9BILA
MVRMSAALAKYWDSFENASDSEIGREKSEDPEQVDTTKKETREWLSQLSLSIEQECSSILYAKSLLNLEESTQQCPSSPKLRSHRVSVLINNPQLSQSLQNVHQPPPKPRRCIARMTAANGNPDIPAFSAATPSSTRLSSYSTQDLVELCRDSHFLKSKEFEQAQAIPQFPTAAADSPRSLRRPIPKQDKGTQWTPPGFRERRRISTIDISGNFVPPTPPPYDQLRIRVERSGSRVIGYRKAVQHQLRHTIAVNHDDIEAAMNNGERPNPNHRSLPPLPSPKSLNSTSTESVDSGQCSGEFNGNCLPPQSERSVDPPPPTLPKSRPPQMRRMEAINQSQDEISIHEEIYANYQKGCLPGYPRMASTMDHVLRTASSIYSLVSSSQTPQTARDLLAKSAVFIQIVESSPCASFLPKYDLDVVRLQLGDLQRSLPDPSIVHPQTIISKPPLITNYFTIVLRRMVEQVLSLFSKIISRYLGECVNKDRLLTIALEHLIHLVLFGDELCLETIQCGGLSSLLKLLRQPTTHNETSRLLLRALAVLCGVSKGCLQLLAVGGLEVILQQLHGTSIPCSIEAAGVLTQLTNPQHAFVQLSNIEAIVIRLLEVIDVCETAESLLLCTAALANTSLQETSAIEFFYKFNAVSRLISAYNRQNCSTIFVQEQLVTILSRMAARHYEDCLVSQGAVPVLLEMLTVTDSIHSDYCRRIRYKAAVCIGTLATTGVGLKALYNNQAYAILCTVLQMENAASNPLGMICANIKSKLEGRYETESAV